MKFLCALCVLCGKNFSSAPPPADIASASATPDFGFKVGVCLSHGSVPVNGRSIFGVSKVQRLLYFFRGRGHFPEGFLVSQPWGVILLAASGEDGNSSHRQCGEKGFNESSSVHDSWPSLLSLRAPGINL